ncbi:MAG: D-alanyl-D-alanine carboxypeptidase, partial [Actinomycetota bacterium]|nr:D-alanyl-D-alanine carboxypeptidase [Actinomycetota bacterium]
GITATASAQETTTGGATNEQTAPAGPAPEAPEIEAQSWALLDLESGAYLDGRNPDERLPIASTTKIMAALVALEEGADLEREVTVSGDAEEFVGLTYSNVGLIAGERLTVRELLVAALVPSGTEAVYALAEALGDGSVDRFVEKMNEQAASMDLENSNFESPAGFDTPDNYSSARDLAKIAHAAMEYPVFAEIVETQEATLSTQNRVIEVFNTNNLLYFYPEATGVKTGTSPEAGPSLVASARDGEELYIAVLLDARDEEYRFEAAQTLLEYAFANYEHRPLVEQDESLERLEVPYRRGEFVELAAAENVVGPSGPGVEAERRVETREPPPAAQAGQELGKVEVLVNGESVGSTPLVATSGYEEASLWQKAWYWTQGLFE